MGAWTIVGSLPRSAISATIRHVLETDTASWYPSYVKYNLHIHACTVLAFLLSLPWQAHAVLFDATGDTNYNTTPPTGALTNSGWQFEGQFGNFLGTPIAPHYFLTAWHLFYYGLVSTNTPFSFDGTNYTVVSFTHDQSPESDLALCRVAEHLPRYAPTYTGTNEVGATIAVFGRGRQRGAPVVTGGITNGWKWYAPADLVMRWGSNRVERIETDDHGAPYLYATFDHGAGPDECALAEYDSGGASFVLEDGVWQLAGIHWAVDGYFNTTNTGDGFNASIYDGEGLYIGNSSDWTLITTNTAYGFYSSRVSAHYAWLTNQIPDFDSEANRLPDWWKLQYSGSIHGMSPTNDPDNDGQNNLAEWIARTDPTNPASFFRTDAIVCTNDTATLFFTGWTNRLYKVFFHDQPLTNDVWTLATTNAFAGSNGPTAWFDTNLTTTITSRVYRLEVSLPQ